MIYRGPTSRKRFNTRVVNRVCTGLPLLIPPLLSLPPPLLSAVPTGWDLWKCQCDLCDRLPFSFAYPYRLFRTLLSSLPRDSLV